jgi:PAP2 superfamily
VGIAAVIALLGCGRGRRAALEGVVSIAVTSATVNLGLKSLHRRRPERVEPDLPPARLVVMPDSSSFPSGHAASAFAFAYAVGRHLPELAVPIRLLAAGSPTRVSTPASITRATSLSAPSPAPEPRPWSPRRSTASPHRAIGSGLASHDRGVHRHPCG